MKLDHEGSLYFPPNRGGVGEGAADIDAIEQYENWFGIVFCYTCLNPKVQKGLLYTTLQGVSWEADFGMEIGEQVTLQGVPCGSTSV